jgi:hypothetical protein
MPKSNAGHSRGFEPRKLREQLDILEISMNLNPLDTNLMVLAILVIAALLGCT